MSRITALIITRHGETEWNRALKHQGHLDSPLTPAGIQQAQALAESLKDQPIAALYSSDLGRAMATAAILGAALDLTVQAEPRLRENSLGILQGLTLDEFKERHPQRYREYLRRDPDYALPGGESLRQFHHRTMACLTEIVARHPGQTILAVGHGGTLGCIFREVFRIPFGEPRHFSLKNVSYNLFTIRDGQWRLETWGQTSHLRNIATLDELRS
ncbi:phosphoglycerate mutase [Hydrogenispora ethanolica]|uniref:Phosphoglycerate mutase n=1 Tax=Hydrogenispora ethanolica TaxID=1082276 RepID=A0A4R1QW98_HYDET|nr:histidine phosphatase family protein [Hydrogenispora ethanolica]TCL55354.1 phosphoglycerate mutase [Hydrogenispora ethanolica]